MQSFTCRRFWNEFNKLPKETQERIHENYISFMEDPDYPELNLKPIPKFKKYKLFSIKAKRKYRALGVMSGDNILWFWIGTHDDYMQKLKNTNLHRSMEIAHENLAKRLQ